MEFEFLNVLFMLFVVFVSAKVASFIFNRIGIPGLVGEILVGVIFATVVIGDSTIAEKLGLFDMSLGDDYDKTTMYHILEVFSELGVMFLLFSVGLETRVKDLMSVGKAAFLVASLGVIIPFCFGYAYIEFFQDGNMYHALFLGAAMVATSVGITARVIKDMRLTDAKESRIIIGAAVIDDILGMIVLAIVSGMANSGGDIDVFDIVRITLLAFGFVIGVMLFAYFVVPKIKQKVQEYNDAKFEKDKNYIPTKFNMMILGIALCFGFAWLAETIGLAAIIGAFLAGMLFADYAVIWGMEEKVEAINSLLVSFFFVNVGLKVNLSGIDSAMIITIVAVIALAVLGKFIGCSIGAKLGDKSLERSSTNIIGIGMVPRGEVGIIVASIGLKISERTGMDIFSIELYTVVVLMSVITTIIAPPLLSAAFKKKYKTDYVVQPDDQM